ncbi:MAG: UDP-N-acetylmuramoyl-tripeptide--D-alanyl-D-alanine ligase [Synechococcus sp. MED-G67]|mgnify:FL=1|nr:MAG: UDP-N-acetylmuramoyl-tripeptide--D-alanyl-D-alanine ligase [Synechococcus sp. MED-G67]|tara:strand:+ start:354 stop:1742 length:1389 start_codon:yes stop_codon:yes gene_type:complete
MSPSLCLQDLARLLDAPVQRRSAPADPTTLAWTFEHISTDSRALQPGDLFIPLRGERFDGHDFLDAAVSVGVAGALIARDWAGYVPEQLATVVVDDTLSAYQQIALAWRRQLHCPVVAVTGSAGKTTTRELIKACLSPLGAIESSVGNENNDIGVPRTMLRSNSSHAGLVLEMGMRGLGEIHRLSVCAEPDVAVITNIGTAHIGRLGSRAAIAQAKCEITDRLKPSGLLVIPAGDPLLEAEVSRVWNGRVQRVALSDDPLEPGTPAPDWVAQLQGQSIELASQGLKLTNPLEGRHNARNFLLALAAAQELGVTAEQLRDLSVSLPGGRARRLSINGVSVLDETYNASPEAMLASLELLKQQPGGHRYAVVGTMLELGDQSLSLHRQVGEKATALGLDGLVVVASEPEASAVMQGAAGLSKLVCVASPEAAAEPLKQWLRPGDHVLLKASRGIALERLIPLLS